MTTTPLDATELALVMKMQSVLDGEANDKIAMACSFIIANAVAILAHDRPDSDRMLELLARKQKSMLDGCWEDVRAELERRKLL